MKNVAPTKQDILSVLFENRMQIRSLGVKNLGLFGSFLHGQQTVNSDVDLLVEFEPAQKTFDNFMNLTFLLEDLLHHQVDLVTVESLSPYIGPHILREVEYASLAA